MLGDLCLVGRSKNVVEIRFDIPSTILGDVRVREALNIAFDRYEIAEELFGGSAVTAQPLLQGATGYNAELELWPYDPERAADLIAEAKADGVVFDAPILFFAQVGRFPASMNSTRKSRPRGGSWA